MIKKKYVKPDISKEELEKALLEVNEKLWQANQKLAMQEQTRMELFSNLSHDLRSPVMALSSAVEYLQTLEDTKTEERQKLYLVMQKRLKNLQAMLNDLFLLTLVESPTVSLSFEIVEIGAFLEEFFYLCEADSKYAGRKLSFEARGPLAYQVRMDTEKMVRVLENLLGNALRYSEEGTKIILGAELRKEQRDVMIWVKDYGIGIAKEEQKHIFEYSYRVNRARTPGEESSGLGLGIAKGIVEKHSGKIWCESELHKGSSFYFTLPVYDKKGY